MGVLLVVVPQVVVAQEEGPALPESSLTMEQLVEGLSDGSVTLQSVRRRGLEMFTTSFNTFDGFGDGPSAEAADATGVGSPPRRSRATE